MQTEPEPERRILELFSGIGGMHSAFSLSGLRGHVVAAIDINTVANRVYAHNHPSTPLLTRNIQKMDAALVRRLGANTILMSPPCQPFTRTGNRQDVADARTDALRHLCELLPQLDTVDTVLMENVKGFETSVARDLYLAALREAGYHWQELIVSPSQLAVPNTRFRYYCLARKWAPFEWGDEDGAVLERFPDGVGCGERRPPFGTELPRYLDAAGGEGAAKELLVADAVLEKRVRVLDIAGLDGRRTMCFTKAYTHYTEGTGSVFAPHEAERVVEIFAELDAMEADDGAARLRKLHELRLRYFSPTEVARLMCFPVASQRRAVGVEGEVDADGAEGEECFEFPAETTTRQRYRLLGNSINVYVVAELIRLLFGPIKEE